MKNKKLFSLFLSSFVLTTSLVSCDISSFLDKIDDELGFNNSITDEINVEELTKQEQIYELAKAAGYQGSYEQWLNSIKGKDGKDGEDGKDGLTPEFRVENGMLQWKYTTSSVWIDLYDLGSLKDNEESTTPEDSSVPKEIIYCNYEEFAKAAEAETTDLYALNGTVIAININSLFLMSDEGKFFEAYRPTYDTSFKLKDLYPLGSKVEVIGVPSIYYGLYEFYVGCSVNFLHSQEYNISFNNVTDTFSKASSKTDSVLNPLLGSPVEVNATLSSISKNSLGFNIEGSSAEFEYRVVTGYFENETTTSLVENLGFGELGLGDKVTLKGLLINTLENKYIVPISYDSITIVEKNPELPDVNDQYTAILDISDLSPATYVDNLDFGNIIVKASDNYQVVIDYNTKSFENMTFIKRLKLSGTGTADYRSIHFNVDKKSVIRIIGMSSSSAMDREAGLFNLDGTELYSSTFTGALNEYVFEVEAGQYYFASKDAGINIYYISIE